MRRSNLLINIFKNALIKVQIRLTLRNKIQLLFTCLSLHVSFIIESPAFRAIILQSISLIYHLLSSLKVEGFLSDNVSTGAASVCKSY